MHHLITPDGRYFVHNGRLSRCSNPSLKETEKTQFVRELTDARRAVKSAKAKDDAIALARARQNVNKAKIALGERGPTWWDDELDYNRTFVEDTPYIEWWNRELRKEI